MNKNNGWTEERKQKQREAIQRWKPWEKATGAKTVEGKNRSKMNALKHGARSQQWRELNRLLRDQQEYVLQVNTEIEGLRCQPPEN